MPKWGSEETSAVSGKAHSFVDAFGVSGHLGAASLVKQALETLTRKHNEGTLQWATVPECKPFTQPSLVLSPSYSKNPRDWAGPLTREVLNLKLLHDG